FLKETAIDIEETVVVGYGAQKKESVVGAITQTTGEVLERTGGVTNLGMALTGNLPGLVTTTSTGMPGGEDPQILIRAQTSWNNRYWLYRKYICTKRCFCNSRFRGKRC